MISDFGENEFVNKEEWIEKGVISWQEGKKLKCPKYTLKKMNAPPDNQFIFQWSEITLLIYGCKVVEKKRTIRSQTNGMIKQKT